MKTILFCVFSLAFGLSAAAQQLNLEVSEAGSRLCYSYVDSSKVSDDTLGHVLARGDSSEPRMVSDSVRRAICKAMGNRVLPPEVKMLVKSHPQEGLPMIFLLIFFNGKGDILGADLVLSEGFRQMEREDVESIFHNLLSEKMDLSLLAKEPDFQNFNESDVAAWQLLYSPNALEYPWIVELE